MTEEEKRIINGVTLKSSDKDSQLKADALIKYNSIVSDKNETLKSFIEEQKRTVSEQKAYSYEEAKIVLPIELQLTLINSCNFINSEFFGFHYQKNARNQNGHPFHKSYKTSFILEWNVEPEYYDLVASFCREYIKASNLVINTDADVSVEKFKCFTSNKVIYKKGYGLLVNVLYSYLSVKKTEKINIKKK